MTPGARVQAAIEILDHIFDGVPAEKALTGWARRSRFAGSKDRAAVRDHVFEALRNRRSFAALGGAETGRGIMIGACRAAGNSPDTVFDGQGHAPAVLTDLETATGSAPNAPGEVMDLPDWLVSEFEASFGERAGDMARKLKTRAPVYLRVNLAKTTVFNAIKELSSSGVSASAHPLSETALEVTDGARKVTNSTAYQNGLVELQDAASQAVVDLLPLADGQRVLDFCAGGGGKSLAMAAQANARFFAHDINRARMKDLPKRAARAGVQVNVVDTGDLARHAPYDVILCDVPCSGSGAWRRSPEGKWRLTAEAFKALRATQAAILDEAAQMTAPDGVLAYATCSLLRAENQQQVDAFLERNPGWTCSIRREFSLESGADGFFTAHLTRV